MAKLSGNDIVELYENVETREEQEYREQIQEEMEK